MDQLSLLCQQHDGPLCSVCGGHGYTTYRGKAAAAVAVKLAAAAAKTAAKRERAGVQKTLPALPGLRPPGQTRPDTPLGEYRNRFWR